METTKKKIRLLGTPLSQSFAAKMQNKAYEAMNENIEYDYWETDVTQLESRIKEIRQNEYLGCAVTRPNKIEVIKYLDELDPLCAKIGSCNTVVKKDGKLVGYNTDALGFYESIKNFVDIENNSFFVIGAGGVARAIVAILDKYKAKKVYINDKYHDIAINLANEYDSCEAVNDFSKVNECLCVINGSGVGMGKSEGRSPIDKNYLKPDHYCFDACYNPDKTQFLLDAMEKGCKVLNGLEMSLYQGVVQIELWTNKKAPVEVMKNTLEDIVREL